MAMATVMVGISEGIEPTLFLAAFGLASNSPDGNGPDGFGNIGIPNDEMTVQLVHHKWTLWNVLKAHESFIFVAILIVLGIGIFVSTFAQCLEYKSAEPKTYGHVIKFAESDVDDGTDSELDLIDDQ